MRYCFYCGAELGVYASEPSETNVDKRTRPGDAEMKTHELKSWPEFFADILAGKKMFELRRNDRDYRPGDELALREWEPGDHPDKEATAKYTGRSVRMRVTYVLNGAGVGCIAPLKGLAIGYCILGIEHINLDEQHDLEYSKRNVL